MWTESKLNVVSVSEYSESLSRAELLVDKSNGVGLTSEESKELDSLVAQISAWEDEHLPF